jgi:hypothetical protein
MLTLTQTRIRVSRLLALLRWVINHQNHTHQLARAAEQIAIEQITKTAFERIRMVLRTRRSFPEVFPTIEFVPSVVLPSVSSRAIAGRMISECAQSAGIRVAYAGSILRFCRKGQYSFAIRIRRNGALALSDFSVVWPSSIQPVMFAAVSRTLSQVIRQPGRAIAGCQRVLQQVYVHGIFLSFVAFLVKQQRAENIRVVHQRDVVQLLFPERLGSGRSFTLHCTNSRVFLRSDWPLARPHSGALRWPPSVQPLERRFISIPIFPTTYALALQEARQCAFYTRLHAVWTRFAEGIELLNIRSARSVFENWAGDYFSVGMFMISITIDARTGAIVIWDRDGIPWSSVGFEMVIDGPESGHAVVRTMFLHCFIKMVFGPIVRNCAKFAFGFDQTCTFHFTPVFVFSFAPEFGLFFMDQRREPQICLRSIDAGCSIATAELLELRTVPEEDLNRAVYAAIASAKQAILLIKLDRIFRDQGVPRTAGGDQIVFVAEPFEEVRFRLRGSSWSMVFAKACSHEIEQIRFLAKWTSIRFTDWLIQLIFNISTLALMWWQTRQLEAMHTVIQELGLLDPLGFTISFIHPFCTRLSVTLESVVALGPLYHEVNPAITPQVHFQFGRDIAIRRFLVHLVKTRQIRTYFGSFLNTAFIPLHRLWTVFCEGTKRADWSVDALRDDRSFFLIYQRIHSANLVLKPSQVFQMIVPTIGRSTLLQIPLGALARCRHTANLSHVTLKLNMTELDQFKGIVEDFFGWRDRLVDLGFTGFRLSEGELGCTHPRNIGSLRVRCLLRKTSAVFEVDGEGDLPRAMRTLVGIDFGSTDHQIGVIGFLLSLFDFEPRLLAMVVQLIIAIAARATTFGVDWGESMTQSKASPADGTAMVRIVGDKTSFTTEFTRATGDRPIEVIATDAGGSRAKCKNMKTLTKWIDALGTSVTS